MRRALANLLLAMWIAGSCSALLSVRSAAPACCRADGKHHCALQSPGDGFHAAPCCLYRNITVLSSPMATAVGVQAQSAIFQPRWQTSHYLQPLRIPRCMAGETHKRGPPLA